MNVAIVTQPLLGNYGGILQNFALQRFLIQNGYQPITLDYFPSKPLKTCIKEFCVSLLRSKSNSFSIYYKRTNQMNNFVQTNIRLTSPLYSYKSFPLVESNITAVIVGSDQVWRPRFNKNTLYQMYLNFVDKRQCRKIAYAVSIGVNFWEYSNKQTSKCRKLIETFHAVSVREKSAIQLIQDNLGYSNVKHVLDPTLLISQQIYLDLCVNELVSKEKYIGCYILDKSFKKLDAIQRLSQQLALPIRFCTDYSTSDITIEQWLALFRDASYVVTDSFHGVVFSIIFKKQFVVIANENRGADRFMSLLSMLDLQNRIITSADEIDNISSIDYNIIACLLDKYKKESADFILSSLA